MWAVAVGCLLYVYYFSTVTCLLLELTSLEELSFILSFIYQAIYQISLFPGHVILLVEKWKEGRNSWHCEELIQKQFINELKIFNLSKAK